MLTLTAQTGLRISEVTGLTISDAHLGVAAFVHCVGKGRKERATPLTPLTVQVLRVWLAERRGEPPDPLFPTITGRRLSHDAVEHRLARHVDTAGKACPSMRTKHVGMHTLRHSAAMRLLESGTDVTVIALWLGHEQPSTTAQVYLHADMTLKEHAIAQVTPPGTAPGRYRPGDTLLAFVASRESTPCQWSLTGQRIPDLMRCRTSARDGRLGVVSSIEQPEEPVVRTYTPDEAIRRARPLPPRDRLVIEDVPEEEWAAFQAALADA